jgi:hypothetical protein
MPYMTEKTGKKCNVTAFENPIPGLQNIKIKIDNYDTRKI